MRKLLTAFSAAATFALLTSAGAACDQHSSHVTASADPGKETVAMSTYDGGALPPLAEKPAEIAAAAECSPGAADCPPANE